MGRLIDIDEVKKRLPIMENDWGMVINETLHKELDKVPTVEAISKADMVAILDKIKAEIIEKSITDCELHGCGTDDLLIDTSEALAIIDKYTAGSEG